MLPVDGESTVLSCILPPILPLPLAINIGPPLKVATDMSPACNSDLPTIKLTSPDDSCAMPTAATTEPDVI